MFDRTMAIEMIENGVRINAVAPGTIFSQTARDNYAYDVFEAAKPYIPAKRLGTPEEVAAAVCFLMSPAAAFITGTTVTVDGGQTLYSPPMVQIGGNIRKPYSRFSNCTLQNHLFPFQTMKRFLRMNG